MRTSYITFLFLLSYITCFSQGEKDTTISFVDSLLISKAEFTQFQRKMFGFFSKDKHLEIKLTGGILENIKPENIKVHILDSAFNTMQYRTRARGTMSYSCEKKIARRMKKYSEEIKKENSIIKKKKYYLFKTFLRRSLDDGVSSARLSYSLQKGTYYLYLECSDDSGYFKTNLMKIIFK